MSREERGTSGIRIFHFLDNGRDKPLARARVAKREADADALVSTKPGC